MSPTAHSGAVVSNLRMCVLRWVLITVSQSNVDNVWAVLEFVEMLRVFAGVGNASNAFNLRCRTFAFAAPRAEAGASICEVRVSKLLYIW